MNGITVSFENVSVSYRQKTVLKGISHVFPAGKTTAVLGRSGSGKSSLLRTINGLNLPVSGTVMAGELKVEPATLLRLRQNTGFVIQHNGLFPHLNIGRNIGLPGKLRKMPGTYIKERTAELMQISLLPPAYTKKYPHELSGGEQQRANLCRALFTDPPLLLMDEPFASLDYTTKRSLYAYMKTIQRGAGRTIILVTHDLEEAVELADAFIWIDGGEIRESGDKNRLTSLNREYFNQ